MRHPFKNLDKLQILQKYFKQHLTFYNIVI